MTKAQITRVVNATVRIDGKAGRSQGVLVGGGLILTATHCIDWSGVGGMALGDHYIENITTKSGVRLRVAPLAADPVSDIAVLGSLDDQTFPDDSDKFEEWCEATPAVPLSITIPRVGKPLRVHILTHKQKWIGATITLYAPVSHLQTGCLGIEADDRIQGGTSGGPVVDSNGRLVGIVSHFIEVPAGKKCAGAFPVASLALPRWAWARIIEAAKLAEK